MQLSSIRLNKQIVDTLIDNSSLGDKKQKIEKDIANKENSINEAKENLANLQKQSKDLESQIKEKKDLLKAFKDIEAARAERDTLKEDSERYREQIKNDKKQFEEFDGGLAKYERRLQTTANLVAQLSFDEAGNNKIFDVSDVPVTDQVSFNYDANIKTATCYRKNWQYWNHCKIEFSEGYNDPNSSEYANGIITIPVKNILTAKEIATLKTLLAETKDFEEQTPDIKKMIKDKIEIRRFCIPF